MINTYNQNYVDKHNLELEYMNNPQQAHKDKGLSKYHEFYHNMKLNIYFLKIYFKKKYYIYILY